MTKVGLIKFLFVLLISNSVLAQKVKYKDLFGLLNTKQYEEAEPFMKRYLAEGNNNPNAFLYMGIIYQEKSAKNDVLKQTYRALTNIDSAVFFFNKAKSSIDDREIKRNKEFYQAYNRRDLRTGEFGVKLSDIQFDIDKRIESLKERADRIKMVKHYFTITDSLYKKSNALFRSVQEKYPTEKEFFLRSDQQTISTMNSLATRFDSTLKFFENYRSSLQHLSNSGYNQVIQLQDINDFSKDGASLADFYQDDLRLWDYKKFALKSKETMEKEIIPMRQHLIAYDMELNKLSDKLKKDSASVKSDLTKLIDKLLDAQLKKFDPDPLPMSVFAVKMADLEYHSTRIENKYVLDTADVHIQLQTVLKEKKYLDKLDSLTKKLEGEKIDAAATDYENFISSTYNNPVVLKSYVRGVKEYAGREQKRLEAEIESKREALLWIVTDTESVPLFKEPAALPYYPLLVEEELYTMGLKYKDSLDVSGYFYTITPSRKPDVSISFPVDKPSFKYSKAPQLKALSVNSNNQLYHVVIVSQEKREEKYRCTIAKIYRTDGLSWSQNYALEFMPSELVYSADSGELELVSEISQKVILDKNGKMKELK